MNADLPAAPAPDPSLIDSRIREIKTRLGPELMILGHHYQSEEVIRYADIRGDSFELSRAAAKSQARFIVFCGVHFMAESADILTRPDQTVILPDLDAGCPMADMASAGEVESAWIQLREIDDLATHFTPVTYINSRAEVKAFCGRHGGIVCTSANAPKALDWAWKQHPKVFFLPDQHLGRNTALDQGVPSGEIALWEPSLPLGGNTPDTLRQARIILWKGHCHVHTRFTPGHIAAGRQNHPGARVVVHPECSREVVRAADATGSTGFIIRYVREQPAGRTILVGTELNLVSRLAREETAKTVLPLAPSLCPNMFKNSPEDLLAVLERPGERNVIRVTEEIRRDARLALDRMLDLA